MNGSPYNFSPSGRTSKQDQSEPIAIVGAACRLPGARDLEAFARLLDDRVDAVTEIPDWRWDKSRFFHPARGQRGKAYTFAAGVLEEVDRFDANFFGISPREAVQMDPQQRLCLELAYEALENAGMDTGRLAGEAVGVFVGGSSWDYLNRHISDPATTDAYSMTGITLCSLANRVSYAFDLRGPSFTVDTACSSSLVALHQACEALRSERLPMALVGGVSLLLAPQSFIGFSAASMLSPRGRCHAFDERADGYVRAEGGGFVVLKPLGDAIAAGDPIRAVIRGTGVNSDGRTTGFSLPNREAQAALLGEVYGRFGLDPEDLAYVEAHGTGTPAGDPIEAGALGEMLGRRRKAPLSIGSVKTNIGHLEAGSGMAGLLKAMLVAERGIIPASLHCATPNPNIPFEELNLRLVPIAVALPDETRAGRLIGINSFGFGGTNAHAVLETAPLAAMTAHDEEEAPLPPLLLSAQSDEALKAIAVEWRSLGTALPRGKLAATIRGNAHHRTQHNRRAAIAAPDAASLVTALNAVAEDGSTPLFAKDTAVRGGVAFVFSGNGSQWAGMARDAIAHSPDFRSGLEEVDAALRPWLGWSVAEALDKPDAEALRNTDVAQPLLFAIQVALVLGLRAAGIQADAFMGHSVGEVAAAWAAGALDLPAAARVIAARSGAQQRQHGVGGMGVLGLGAEAVRAALAETALAELGIEVAASNSAQATTVAGSDDALVALASEAKARNWRFTRLDLAYAFHSAAMDPIQGVLAEELDGLEPRAGRGFVSTVTGTRLDGHLLDARYWWRNVREPVLFAEAARTLVDDGYRIFIEIGPHPVLRAYLGDALRAADHEGRVLASLNRRPIDQNPVAGIAMRGHAAGADIREGDAFAGACAIEGLPLYPWQRESFWMEGSDEDAGSFTLPPEHPLLGSRRTAEPLDWSRPIALEIQPWMADHVVGGAAVMPAAALLDMALAAARARAAENAPLELLDAEIGRAMVLEPGVIRDLRLRVGSPAGDFEVSSRPRFSCDPWIVHMRGRIVDGASSDALANVLLSDQPATAHLDSEALYTLAGNLGLEYGPAFRAVSGVDVHGDGMAIAELSATGLHETGFLLSPDLVDGALQGLLALAADKLGSGAGVIPWRFGRVRLLRRDGAPPASARMRLTRVGPRSVRADIALVAADGGVLAELVDCWFVRVALGNGRGGPDAFFHVANVPSTLSATPAPTLPSVVRAAANDTSGELQLLAEAFASAAASEVLRPLAVQGVLDQHELVRDAGISNEALLHRLLGWLDHDGLVEAAGPGRWRLLEDSLPSADTILRTILADAPDAIAEIAALALAADTLPTMLRSGGAAVPLSPALQEQMLIASPAGIAAAAMLGEALREIAEAWPRSRPMRILQIGAGRGSFAGTLLGAIGHRAFELVATAAPDDLPLLAERLEAVPAARAASLATALDGGPFDLVIGYQPTAGGEFVAEHLSDLVPTLASGATLLLADVAPNRVWQLLRPDGAALDDAAWRASLAAVGFGQVESRTIDGGLWPGLLLSARFERATADEPNAAKDWSIVATAGDPLAATLVDAVRKTGGQATLVDALDWPPAGTRLPTRTAMLLGNEPERLARELARIGHVAAAADPDSTAEIALVVRGRTTGDIVAAALDGAARVLANEAATIARRSIRLDPALSIEEAAVILMGELDRSDAEQEVAWNADGRHVLRVRRGLPEVSRAAAPLRLTIDKPGLLDSLGWNQNEAGAPGPGQVAIRIEAAALNFRDVMWAMGLLPDEALLDGFAGATMGLECAGTVTATGEGVDGFALGDRVMAFAPASLATETVTAAHAVMRMPPALDFIGAATVPVAFLTVVYSVGHLARLQPGETILIHGGAGGVGLAAIQYARHLGARVFATAGSAAKRALLSRLGVEAVFDSRSLDFADEVLRLTGGEGVDVVLNSLAGEAMRRSLGLLRPFGRFLELGKRDFYENSSIGLRPFRHNVTYFGIDADQLPIRQPKLASKLFDEISELFASGALRPLPRRTFDYTEVESAFRLMQGSGHIGKIVLVPGSALPAADPTTPAFTASDDGVYLVTGGLDGFGHEAARWLARHGATRLALLGRRGAATPGADEKLATLASKGVDARAYACDVGDEEALATTLATIRNDHGPISGIVHAAVAMDDGLLAQLDEERFARALAPKLGGADALDRLTRMDPISLFLLFSSVTTPMGNPGQANYVAANAAVEAIAERRHAAGLPALAVQWGPVGDVGYLARTQEVSDLLAKQLGGQHMSGSAALDALPALLAAGRPVLGMAAVNWGALRKRLPVLQSPIFNEIGGPAGEEHVEVDLRTLLAFCSPEEAQERATAMLIEEVARIMKLAPERIEPARPLTEFGMDSLMAVELRLAVEQRFGISVPLLALSEGATLSAMAARILRGLGSEATESAPSTEQALTERIRRFEGEPAAAFDGPADRATTPFEPNYAAAAATSP